MPSNDKPSGNKRIPPTMHGDSDRKVGPESKRKGQAAEEFSDDKPPRSERKRGFSGDSVSGEDSDADRKLSPQSKKELDQAESSQGDGLMADEGSKLEAKRAYNRMNAARARKRVKEQLADLCEKVENIKDRNDKLAKKNDDLENLVLTLSEENQILRRGLMEQSIASRSNVLGTRAGESEMTNRLMMEGGAASASFNLARIHANDPNLSANAMLPQLSSLVGLPPGLQLQNADHGAHGSNPSMVHPQLSQQQMPYLYHGDPSRPPWMPPNYPPPHPDGKM